MKKCITISGGFDSGCLPYILKDSIDEYDFVFFNYNQTYLEKEREKAGKLAEEFKKPLVEVVMKDMVHDQERRNFMFISKLKQLQYQEIVMGNRNIFPFFDKYRDSNFTYLKIIGFLFSIKIILPITGWTKSKVLNFLIENRYWDFYNCYLNSTDLDNCECSNCLEMKKVWRKYEKQS